MYLTLCVWHDYLLNSYIEPELLRNFMKMWFSKTVLCIVCVFSVFWNVPLKNVLVFSKMSLFSFLKVRWF